MFDKNKICYNDFGDNMRLRNVKGASEIINNSKYVISDFKEACGKYKEIFGNNNPIHIEIGMGKGDFIIESAKRLPNINFIGIEKFDSVLVRAIQKLDGVEMNNLLLIRMDAQEIPEAFSKEVAVIYLNFSDPWPKARHEHRRLTSKKFLDRYNSVFKNTKKIIMKTDNLALFEYSISSFSDYGYEIEEVCWDLYKEDISENIPTEYETKFKTKGAIYRIAVQKTD